MRGGTTLPAELLPESSPLTSGRAEDGQLERMQADSGGYRRGWKTQLVMPSPRLCSPWDEHTCVTKMLRGLLGAETWSP